MFESLTKSCQINLKIAKFVASCFWKKKLLHLATQLLSCQHCDRITHLKQSNKQTEVFVKRLIDNTVPPQMPHVSNITEMIKHVLVSYVMSDYDVFCGVTSSDRPAPPEVVQSQGCQVCETKPA